MIGEVTRQMLPHLSGVPHLHLNRPLILLWLHGGSEINLKDAIISFRSSRSPSDVEIEA